MFAQNIALVKQKFPDVYIKINQYEKKLSPHIVPSKKSEPTLSVDNCGKTEYIHSQYDPLHEAKRFIEQIPELDSHNHVLFVGAGLGYQISVFTSTYPNKSYSICELHEELIVSLLSSYDLTKDKNLKGLFLGNPSNELHVILQHFIRSTNGAFYVAVLPGYKRIFQEAVDNFLATLQKAIEDSRKLLGVRNAFEKKWLINAMANMKYTVQTNNLFLMENNVFNRRPVIIVAAGPSLSQEIENLRLIKENGTAYIIAVGSAVNSLLHHGIYPDAACTYDPHFHNVNVVQKVINAGADIPLIYGTTVGYTTLPKYPGPMVHVITKTDPVADYLLNPEDATHRIPTVNDAPSIAVIALQLFAHLGADPIVFVGQNLAFLHDQYYATGIQYDGRPTEVQEQDQENVMFTEDVYGNQTRTNWPFYMMKTQLEHYIGAYSGRRYVNTTKGGAKINGAPFMELSEVISTLLTQDKIVTDWVNMPFRSYDRSHIKGRMDRLSKHAELYDKNIDELQRLFKQMDSAARNRNERQAQKNIMKFSSAFSKLQSNLFYNVIVKPMNNIQFEMLANKIDSINQESAAINRSKLILEHVGKFIYECSVSIQNLRPLFNKMEMDIQAHLSLGTLGEVES